MANFHWAANFHWVANFPWNVNFSVSAKSIRAAAKSQCRTSRTAKFVAISVLIGVAIRIGLHKTASTGQYLISPAGQRKTSSKWPTLSGIYAFFLPTGGGKVGLAGSMQQESLSKETSSATAMCGVIVLEDQR